MLLRRRLLAPGIRSLAGIEHLTSLVELSIGFSSITDISPLSGLTSLRVLRLGFNSITDISPLSGLTRLTGLFLRGNSITDISPLSGLTSLTDLSLRDNSISDISALSGLTRLTTLRLDNNSDLSDIQPLLDNTGLGAGDEVNLVGTGVSCTDVAALEAKGVSVTSDCRDDALVTMNRARSLRIRVRHYETYGKTGRVRGAYDRCVVGQRCEGFARLPYAVVTGGYDETNRHHIDVCFLCRRIQGAGCC